MKKVVLVVAGSAGSRSHVSATPIGVGSGRHLSRHGRDDSPSTTVGVVPTGTRTAALSRNTKKDGHTYEEENKQRNTVTILEERTVVVSKSVIDMKAPRTG